MNENEQKVYETLKKEMVLELSGGEIDAKNAGGLSNKLLQLANGSVYDDRGKVIHIHGESLLLDIVSDLWCQCPIS